MTSHAPGEGQPFTPSREDGPFVLRSLLDDVPLSTDGSQNDVKINCVEYYGAFKACWPKPTGSVLTLLQSTISTSAQAHRSCCTLSRYLRIPVIAPADLFTSSLRDSLQVMPKYQAPCPVFNRSYSSPAPARPAYDAIGRSPSTLCRN
jgi:hypothetical protein